VPRIFLEEGRHGDVTWVIEQGAVGGIPLLDFKFGCAANAEAFVASPHQFTYFQAGGFDCTLLSFLEIGADGSVNVSRLAATPHRTAGAGGFVDITARAKRLVFSGTFNAGAKMRIEDGRLVIDREGQDRQDRAAGRPHLLRRAPAVAEGAGDLCDRALRDEAHRRTASS
jgi:propionate CoA-transferase